MKFGTVTTVNRTTAAQIKTKRPRKLMDLLIEADERITKTGGLTHEAFWLAVEADSAAIAKNSNLFDEVGNSASGRCTS